jgi:hypothetical protein
MRLRVAVNEAESWLIADRETLAAFLGVSPDIVPLRPDELPDPKTTMINLARKSKARAVREDMVPTPDSGRKIGPAYVSRLIEYAADYWRPEVAVESSESLKRCVERLKELRPKKSS